LVVACRSLKQIPLTKNAAHHRADRRTDDEPFQTGVVTMTPIAFNPRSGVTAGKETAGSANDRTQDTLSTRPFPLAPLNLVACG
jgi:hypothetical protein